MRSAKILFREEVAGTLLQDDAGKFRFVYDLEWLKNPDKCAIGLNFPKTQEEFRSDFLFPLFYSLLPEGGNKQLVCQRHQIEPDDEFGLLMATAEHDNIGAIRVIKISAT